MNDLTRFCGSGKEGRVECVYVSVMGCACGSGFSLGPGGAGQTTRARVWRQEGRLLGTCTPACTAAP